MDYSPEYLRMKSADVIRVTKVTCGYCRILFQTETGVNYDELHYHYSSPVREQHHMYPMVDGSALCLRL